MPSLWILPPLKFLYKSLDYHRAWGVRTLRICGKPLRLKKFLTVWAQCRLSMHIRTFSGIIITVTLLQIQYCKFIREHGYNKWIFATLLNFLCFYFFSFLFSSNQLRFLLLLFLRFVVVLNRLSSSSRSLLIIKFLSHFVEIFSCPSFSPFLVGGSWLQCSFVAKVSTFIDYHFALRAMYEILWAWQFIRCRIWDRETPFDASFRCYFWLFGQ